MDAAWRRYADTRLWSSWAPHITRVDYPPVTLTPGTRGVVHGPLGVRVRFVVLDVRRPSWSWQVAAGPLVLRLEHDLIATAHGTTATLTLHGPRAVTAPYAPLAWWALRRLVSSR